MQRTGASLALVVALTTGCTTTHEIVQEIPSPSGRMKAVFVHWEPPGGALADTQFTIHVLRADRDWLPMWLRAPSRYRDALWFSEWVYPHYIFWRDDATLEVVVLDDALGDGQGKAYIKLGSGAFEIVTRVAPRLDKATLSGLDQLQLAPIRYRDD